MASLVSYVISTVKPKDYWESVFPGVNWPSAGSEARVRSPLRDKPERTPSLSLNPDTGAWYDHGGDNDGGKSIVSFHVANSDRDSTKQLTSHEAAEEIFHDFVHPTINPKTIRRWARELRETPSLVKFVTDERFVSQAVMEQFSLGTNGNRITLPVKNEFGLFVNAKLYLPGAKRGGAPKMLNYTTQEDPRSFGSPTMLFPIGVLLNTSDDEPIVICEGEFDALALLSLGIMAVSGTAGCKAWPRQYNDLFRGREVVIAYDNDPDGVEYERVPMKQLMSVARVIKRLSIPKLPMPKGGVSKDVTDWMKARPLMRHAKMWRKAIAEAKPLVENPSVYVESGTVRQVPLDEASRAEHYGKRILVDALVTGKDTAPYVLPRRYRATCSKQCDECPLAEANAEFRERTIDPSDPAVLEMVGVGKPQLKKTMLTIAGMPGKPACKSHCTVVETFNLEQLLLIPTLDSKSVQYVMRPSYYVGHGLRSNRAYRFEGTTTADPQDQHTTHLFDKATPAQDEIDTFELTTELKGKLERFRVKGELSPRAVMRHLNSLAEWQSRNVTKIKERHDLHILVDLAFHSVRSLVFNAELVKRGMLDVLIIGDTRAGKGYVAEGLTRYYGLGEVASGENCSFAGLVGGCEAVGKRFIIKWGLIPLNNGRLVVIDEASSLNEDSIGKMSRVRSEGVAEISKIVREVTEANTRLIWLANPRSGRPIMSYNAGVQAIKELVGANEDISRFDLAITVASNEVQSDVINAVADGREDTRDADKFPRDLCRSLILWAWSRESKHIHFTPEATRSVIEHAIEFGKRYNPAIPLVQAENVRIKIAKLSAAIAARVFSTDESYENLIIEHAHVEAACQFMRQCYSKLSMAYDTFSASANLQTVISDPQRLAAAFDNVGEAKTQALTGLLAIHHVTADTLSDYMGDLMAAKSLLSELVQLGCVTRHEKGGYYLKNQSFGAWLRAQTAKD